MKKVFYTEWAYVLGIVFLAVATALTKKANFGVSMVVAPAYLLHLAVSPILPFFTFGVAETAVKLILLTVMCIVIGKFRPRYLISLVSAVLFGLTLDGAVFALDFLPCEALWARVVLYLLGIVACSFGVSLFFHTYIPPDVYELFVKEVSTRFGIKISRFKTFYDCTSCLVGIVLSFAVFGRWNFQAIGVGTVICAFINGPLIGLFSKMLEHSFEFKDAFRPKCAKSSEQSKAEKV